MLCAVKYLCLRQPLVNRDTVRQVREVIQGRCPTECRTLLKGLSVGCCTSCQGRSGDCGELLQICRISSGCGTRLPVRPWPAVFNVWPLQVSSRAACTPAFLLAHAGGGSVPVLGELVPKLGHTRAGRLSRRPLPKHGAVSRTSKCCSEGLECRVSSGSPFTGCECRVSSCGQLLLARQLPQARSSNTPLLDIA